MSGQTVVPTFNRWMLTPDVFDQPAAVNWPQSGAGPGLLFHETGTADPAGATSYPATVPLFSPRNILRPARENIDLLGYVWWGVDLTLLGVPLAAKTKVMWGMEMASLWDGGPVQTGVYTANGWACRKSTGVGYSGVWQGPSGDVPLSNLVYARTDSGISFDPDNGVAETQAASVAVNPQLAASIRTFNVGDTLCGVYRDPLRFIYTDTDAVVKLSDAVSFKNIMTEAIGPKVSKTGATVTLTGTSLQAVNNSFQIWRLQAGYPATGLFSAGFDFDGDRLNDVDNYAGPINLLGVELYVV